MRLRVDPEVCTGHGRCYSLAPEVFDEDERGHCLLPAPEVAPEHEERARAGADACPERAIRIEERAR